MTKLVFGFNKSYMDYLYSDLDLQMYQSLSVMNEILVGDYDSLFVCPLELIDMTNV